MRKTILALSLLGMTLLGITALRAREPGGAEAAPARGEAAAPPDLIAAEGRVVAYPGAEVVVGAESGGRLVRLPAAEGQEVAKGELLAEMAADDLRASLLEARARLTEAEAEARLAEADLARRRELFAQSILPRHDLDGAQRDLDVAVARSETARAAAARWGAILQKMRVLSPIAGTVIRRHRHPGEMVDSGQPLLTLADLRRLRIEGEADEADEGGIVVGAPVLIRADAYPGRQWRGAVEEVSDTVTSRRLTPQDPRRATDVRVLTVKVAFLEATPLKLGTTVDLKIERRVR
jgi:HlyD family secretion protein